MERLEITGDYDNIDWSEVIPVLMAYAYVLVGERNPKMARSREELAYDFAIDAITKYLNNPEKFDPSRNPDLIRYLKYNILRQLISNAKKKASNVREIPSDEENDDLEYDSENTENIFAENYELEEKIDTVKLVAIIEEAIKNEDELYEIFIARYYYQSKRSESCTDLNISSEEYDNRIRRLRRITEKILNSFK